MNISQYQKPLLVAAALLLGSVSASAFADVTVATNFSQLTSNINYTSSSILKIVQVVVTLAGILLAFRGVMHLKQHSSGSPQEKHLSKGLANIIFAAVLFIVVPLLHMLVGSLSDNVGGQGVAYTTGWASGNLEHAQKLESDSRTGP